MNSCLATPPVDSWYIIKGKREAHTPPLLTRSAYHLPATHEATARKTSNSLLSWVVSSNMLIFPRGLTELQSKGVLLLCEYECAPLSTTLPCTQVLFRWLITLSARLLYSCASVLLCSNAVGVNVVRFVCMKLFFFLRPISLWRF